MFTKGMAAQGRMLANVVKYILTNLDDNNAAVFKDSLNHLARVHNARGVTADHYSVMGMTLVHTVRICTGDKYFTDAHKDAWVHIYSKMMSVIIPVVVAGTIPDLADLDRPEQFGRSVYTKVAAANLNADGDQVHESKLAAAAAEARAAKEAKAAAKKAKKGLTVTPVKKQFAMVAAPVAPANHHATGGDAPASTGHTVTACPASGATPMSAVGKCPASGMGGNANGSSPFGNRCPATGAAMGTGGADDLPRLDHMESVSVTLQQHFTHSANSHMHMLRETHDAQQAGAGRNGHGHGHGGHGPHGSKSHKSSPQDKYSMLKRVLGVAQQVEMQLRDQGADAISGAQLSALLESSDMVPDHASALQTANCFLQFQLMFLVPGTGPDAHIDELVVERERALPSPSASDRDEAKVFSSDDTSLYMFGTPDPLESPSTPGTRESSRSAGDPNLASPKCYVRPAAPSGGIINALDRTPSSSAAPTPPPGKIVGLAQVLE